MRVSPAPLCLENMYRSPYPLGIRRQSNGDLVISDGFLFWKKEIRINPDSDRVILTVSRLFGRSVTEGVLADLVARTAPTTEGTGVHVVSGVAGVLCMHSTEIVYTKANTAESVMAELQSLGRELDNKLQIENAA